MNRTIFEQDWVVFIKTAVSQITSSICAQNNFKISVKDLKFCNIAPLRPNILQNIELFHKSFICLTDKETQS